jgi:hypothetical protein
MLLAEAEAIECELAGPIRTPEERMADTFVELTHRVHEALTRGRLAQ